MRELEENNCEIRSALKLKLSIWDRSINFSAEEFASTELSKESKLEHTFGGFLGNDCKYAWMSYETQLAIIDIRYSKCISTWNFAHKVTSVASFPSEPGKIPLLLVGLDNNATRIKDSIGFLCVYDCCTSTIFTLIQVSAGVEKACVIHGGADWEEFNEIRPDSVLPENTGLIFAALRNLQHVVIDINRSSWENLFFEERSIIAKLDFMNIKPLSHAISSKHKKERVHLAYDLMEKAIEEEMGFDREAFESTLLYDENLCSVVYSSLKTGLLITGCLGRIIIWRNNGSIAWISEIFDENSYVTHITLLEPSDDPRPFFYLWIVSQSDAPGSSAVLRMYALLFGKKHTDKSSESSIYFDLESQPSLKFELELDQGERVHSLQAIERENLNSADVSSRKGEDSLLLIGSNERVLIFDLNRWYKEQMPRTMSECGNPNSVMASYRPKDETNVKTPGLKICYIPRSLREFPIKGPSSPEELFYPNSLTFEWIEISTNTVSFWLARGVQSEILRDITLAGPILLTKPTETFKRCLVAGLVPFDSVPQDYNYDAPEPEQREMLLTLCLEQRLANFLVRCATEWSDGSAAFLYPEFLRWVVQRASELKLISDQICIPLFDQSGTNIGETEVKTLRFGAQQLECLTSVVTKLPSTETDIEKQRRALKRISTYLQVLLWFHDAGLLPENQEIDETETSQFSLKIPYPREILIESYKKKREALKSINGQEDSKMFIDNFINKNCQPLRAQWEKEAGANFEVLGGCYPPPSLQSLLRSYLTDCYHQQREFLGKNDEYDRFEMNNKHIITIYLLMDLAMLLQASYPSVDRLIKYPAAFKLSPSLIKLTQAFWLLDHEDFEGFFKIMTSQLILASDIQDWHHKLAIETLLHNDQHKLALIYMRVLKPPLSSIDDQGTIIGLSVGQGLIEAAFHTRPPSHYAQLLTKFFQACKAHGKLKKVLYLSLDPEEEAAFVKFLEEGGCNDTKLLYYLQRGRHTEASDLYCLDKFIPTSRSSTVQKKIHPTAIKILGAFNATLPEITKCFANIQSKSNRPYIPLSMQKSFSQSSFVDPHSVAPRTFPRPMSQCRDKLQEIFSVAIHKTRETCQKTDRNTHNPNYLPFLAAPSSTIVYCTRVTGNSVPETTEAVAVTYSDKRDLRGKRPFESVNEPSNEATQIKRRKISNEINDMAAGDSESRNFRRLSMSQVCCTPLIERKKQVYGKNADGVIVETPQSILKIRQMLERSSNSSGFGFRHSDSFSEKNSQTKNLAAGDSSKPTRQIRFSVDRLSDDDGSNSVEDSINYQNNDLSNISKTTEDESCMEKFYSPDVSVQSIRDSSFLSDNSTKFIRGPRARPTIKRSQQSHSSSDCQSVANSSKNTTLDVSEMDVSTDKPLKKQASSLRKSILQSQTSLYHVSILNPDSSAEDSVLYKPSQNNDSAVNNETESEISEEDMSVEETRQDKEVSAIDSGVVKDSNDDPHITSVEDEELEEGELRDDEEEVKNENESSVACPISQQYEISEDEEVMNEVEGEINTDVIENFDQEHEMSEDEAEVETQNIDDSKMEEIVAEVIASELNQVECFEEQEEVQQYEQFQEPVKEVEQINQSNKLEEDDDHEDSFQSFSDSINYIKDSSLNDVNFFPRTSTVRESFSYGCSLTENIPLNQTNKSEDQFSHSLTKPIFINSKGILRFSDSNENPIDLTDDESQDSGEMEKVTLNTEEDENEENNITLNLSDGSDGEKKVSEKEKDESLKNASTALVSDLQDELLKTRSLSNSPSPNESHMQLQQSTSLVSSIKSDELPTFESHRRSTITGYRHVTPRRPIHSYKSTSLSPKTSESSKTISIEQKENREKRSLSLTKEVENKNLHDTLIQQSCIPTIVIERLVTLEEETNLQSPKTEQSSSYNVSPSGRRKLSTVEEVTEKSSQITQHTSMETEIPELESKSLERKTPVIDEPSSNVCAGSSDKDTSDVINEEAMEDDSVVVSDKEKKASRVQDSSLSSKIIPVVSPIEKTTGDINNEVAMEEDSEANPQNETRTSQMQESSPLLERVSVVTSIEETTSNADADLNSKSVVKIGQDVKDSISSEIKQIEAKVSNIVRKTRAASVALEEEGVLEERIVSVMRRARGTSVTENESKAENKTSSASISINPVTEKKDDETVLLTRKTRAASVANENDASATSKKTTIVSMDDEKNDSESKTLQSTHKKTRAASVAEEKSPEEKSTTRKTRAGSVVKEKTPEEKSTSRKTRASSVVEENTPQEKTTSKKTRAASAARENEKPEELVIDKSAAPNVNNDIEKSTSRKTKATSIAKEDDKIEGKPTTRKTRATSIAKEDDKLEEKPRVRKTRAASVTKNDSVTSEKSLPRKRKAASVTKDEDAEEIKTPIARRTRAGSTAKEEGVTKTRAASITKDTNNTDEQDLSIPKVTGKRGNSLPKDIITENNRMINRARRSTSLMKDVILEESLSQLSPTSSISRRSRLFDSPIVSSPAANTRSRRSSIQSVPEDLEQVLSNVKSPTKKEDSRVRRAISVDSTVILPPGKRLTRSRLAKITLSDDVIPEDKPVERKNTRRKRDTSTDVNEKEEKQGKIAARPKRGRKESESKHLENSVPTTADDIKTRTGPGDESQMSTKLTELQKFISSVSDEETNDEATNIIRFDKKKSDSISSKIQGGPRTYFVMPKKKRDKAK